jgi:hypothetical protein
MVHMKYLIKFSKRERGMGTIVEHDGNVMSEVMLNYIRLMRVIFRSIDAFFKTS